MSARPARERDAMLVCSQAAAINVRSEGHEAGFSDRDGNSDSTGDDAGNYRKSGTSSFCRTKDRIPLAVEQGRDSGRRQFHSSFRDRMQRIGIMAALAR